MPEFIEDDAFQCAVEYLHSDNSNYERIDLSYFKLNYLVTNGNMLLDHAVITNIIYLDISHNNLQSINELQAECGLFNLKVLNASHNQLVNPISLCLPRLSILNLSNNNLTSFVQFSGLISLTEINLNHNHIKSLDSTSLSYIHYLSELRSLDVSHNDITCTPSEMIKFLHKIECLPLVDFNIHGNPFESDYLEYGLVVTSMLNIRNFNALPVTSSLFSYEQIDSNFVDMSVHDRKAKVDMVVNHVDKPAFTHGKKSEFKWTNLMEIVDILTKPNITTERKIGRLNSICLSILDVSPFSMDTIYLSITKVMTMSAFGSIIKLSLNSLCREIMSTGNSSHDSNSSALLGPTCEILAILFSLPKVAPYVAPVISVWSSKDSRISVKFANSFLSLGFGRLLTCRKLESLRYKFLQKIFRAYAGTGTDHVLLEKFKQLFTLLCQMKSPDERDMIITSLYTLLKSQCLDLINYCFDHFTVLSNILLGSIFSREKSHASLLFFHRLMKYAVIYHNNELLDESALDYLKQSSTFDTLMKELIVKLNCSSSAETYDVDLYTYGLRILSATFTLCPNYLDDAETDFSFSSKFTIHSNFPIFFESELIFVTETLLSKYFMNNYLSRVGFFIAKKLENGLLPFKCLSGEYFKRLTSAMSTFDVNVQQLSSPHYISDTKPQIIDINKIDSSTTNQIAYSDLILDKRSSVCIKLFIAVLHFLRDLQEYKLNYDNVPGYEFFSEISKTLNEQDRDFVLFSLLDVPNAKVMLATLECISAVPVNEFDLNEILYLIDYTGRLDSLSSSYGVSILKQLLSILSNILFFEQTCMDDFAVILDRIYSKHIYRTYKIIYHLVTLNSMRSAYFDQKERFDIDTIFESILSFMFEFEKRFVQEYLIIDLRRGELNGVFRTILHSYSLNLDLSTFSHFLPLDALYLSNRIENLVLVFCDTRQGDLNRLVNLFKARLLFRIANIASKIDSFWYENTTNSRLTINHEPNGQFQASFGVLSKDFLDIETHPEFLSLNIEHITGLQDDVVQGIIDLEGLNGYQRILYNIITFYFPNHTAFTFNDMSNAYIQKKNEKNKLNKLSIGSLQLNDFLSRGSARLTAILEGATRREELGQVASDINQVEGIHQTEDVEAIWVCFLRLTIIAIRQSRFIFEFLCEDDFRALRNIVSICGIYASEPVKLTWPKYNFLVYHRLLELLHATLTKYNGPQETEFILGVIIPVLQYLITSTFFERIHSTSHDRLLCLNSCLKLFSAAINKLGSKIPKSVELQDSSPQFSLSSLYPSIPIDKIIKGFLDKSKIFGENHKVINGHTMMIPLNNKIIVMSLSRALANCSTFWPNLLYSIYSKSRFLFTNIYHCDSWEIIVFTRSLLSDVDLLCKKAWFIGSGQLSSICHIGRIISDSKCSFIHPCQYSVLTRDNDVFIYTNPNIKFMEKSKQLRNLQKHNPNECFVQTKNKWLTWPHRNCTYMPKLFKKISIKEIHCFTYSDQSSFYSYATNICLVKSPNNELIYPFVFEDTLSLSYFVENLDNSMIKHIEPFYSNFIKVIAVLVGNKICLLCISYGQVSLMKLTAEILKYILNNTITDEYIDTITIAKTFRIRKVSSSQSGDMSDAFYVDNIEFKLFHTKIDAHGLSAFMDEVVLP